MSEDRVYAVDDIPVIEDVLVSFAESKRHLLAMISRVPGLLDDLSRT